MTNSTVRRLNATSTGEILTFEAPEDDLARLDQLPVSLRGCLYQSATKLAAKAFAEHLAWARNSGLGALATVEKVDEIEANEIAVFAGQYRAQCGSEYPHTAAGVSIQRYGDPGPSRHPPKRYGKPVLHHGKRRRNRAMVG